MKLLLSYEDSTIYEILILSGSIYFVFKAWKLLLWIHKTLKTFGFKTYVNFKKFGKWAGIPFNTKTVENLSLIFSNIQKTC